MDRDQRERQLHSYLDVWLLANTAQASPNLCHAVIYGMNGAGTRCYNIARCRQGIRAERLFVRVHNVQQPYHSKTNPACWPPDSQTAGSGFWPSAGCSEAAMTADNHRIQLSS